MREQIFPTKYNPFNRPQLCGKARSGLSVSVTEREAFDKLEKAAAELVKHARWSGYMSKINELRRPLLELRLARRPRKLKML